MDYQLVAVKVGHREETATAVQAKLTEFGCNIKVRLGLHDLPNDDCAPAGLIILQVSAGAKKLDGFLSGLNDIDGVTAKSLVI